MSLQDSPTLSELMRTIFTTLLSDQLHTVLPGIITEYDSKTRKATVQPQVDQKFLDGEKLQYQPIVEIPVISMQVGNAGLRLPESQYVDQTCVLIFSERSLDNWLLQDGAEAPNDPRKFDITDGICIVGLHRFINEDEGGNDLNLEYNDTKITIRASGDIELDGGNKIIVKANGDIELGTSGLRKLVSDSFQPIFHGHRHNYIDGVGIGVGNTSTPCSLVPNLITLPVAILPSVPPTGLLGLEIPTTALTTKVSAQ